MKNKNKNIGEKWLGGEKYGEKIDRMDKEKKLSGGCKEKWEKRAALYVWGLQ